MKLTATAIEKISSRNVKLMLALALGFTEPWIEKVIKANKENGPLTTVKAVQTIMFETGLKEYEILVETKKPAAVTK